MKTRFSSQLFAKLALVAEKAPDMLPSISARIRDIPAHLYPFTALTEVVENAFDGQLARAESLSGKFPEELAHSISTLLYTIAASHQPPSELRGEIVAKFKKSYPLYAESLTDFLESILSCRDVLESFKSTALREDNENILLDSKIIIDIRPVFDLDLAQEIVSNTVLHRLKLTFRSASEVENIILTLGQPELDELSTAISRAQKKLDSIRRQLNGLALGRTLESKE